MPLSHGCQTAVPVQQLKRGHQLLKLEHRMADVRLQHVAKRVYPATVRVEGRRRVLQRVWESTKVGTNEIIMPKDPLEPTI